MNSHEQYEADRNMWASASRGRTLSKEEMLRFCALQREYVFNKGTFAKTGKAAMTIISIDRIEDVESLREAQRIFNAAGFVIVPKKATQEMLDAYGQLHATLDYEAMIKAAPKLV